MKIKKIILFIALFVLLPYARIVFSYEAAVHPLITSKAIDKSKLADETDYLKEQLGFGLDEQFNGSTVRNWIEQGSSLEDNPKVDGWIRAPRHLYDPTRPPGRLTDITEVEAWLCGPFGQYTSALEWAWDRSLPDADPYSWTDAINYYYSALTGTTKASRDDNFANTFRALGQVIHLIEDMAVPAHVRNDNHAPHYGKDYYECYLTPQRFTEFLTAIEGADVYHPNTFNGYFGLADYTNYNYVSDDTILTENLPSNHVHYFAHPNLASTDFSITGIEIQVVTAEDGKQGSVRYLNKVSDGEIIDKFAGITYFGHSPFDDPNVFKLGLKVDDEVAYHYAEKLLPKAVGYSAGLIDYFFRGEMEASYNPSSEILTVQNESGMVMNGTFEVYWDNEEGVRSGPLISWTANVPVEGTTQSSVFSLPSEAETEIVVFNGTIGSEEAIAGKVGLYHQYTPTRGGFWRNSAGELREANLGTDGLIHDAETGIPFDTVPWTFGGTSTPLYPCCGSFNYESGGSPGKFWNGSSWLDIPAFPYEWVESDSGINGFYTRQGTYDGNTSIYAPSTKPPCRIAFYGEDNTDPDHPGYSKMYRYKIAYLDDDNSWQESIFDTCWYWDYGKRHLIVTQFNGHSFVSKYNLGGNYWSSWPPTDNNKGKTILVHNGNITAIGTGYASLLGKFYPVSVLKDCFYWVGLWDNGQRSIWKGNESGIVNKSPLSDPISGAYFSFKENNKIVLKSGSIYHYFDGSSWHYNLQYSDLGELHGKLCWNGTIWTFF